MFKTNLNWPQMAVLVIGVLVSSNAISAISKKSIDKFCDKHGEVGSGTVPLVLKSMPPGNYLYPYGGSLLLYTNNRYLLKLPQGYRKTKGTSYNDYLAFGGIVGGCSKQQLSEAMKINDLIASRFVLTKTYR